MSERFLGLLRSVGASIDKLYASVVHSTSSTKFFSHGWGEISALELSQFEDLVKHVQTGRRLLDIEWRHLRSSKDAAGRGYQVHVGVYASPWTAPDVPELPESCKHGRVWLIRPEDERHGPLGMRACVLQLPATGEHSFHRREYICKDLLQQGIGSLILEGPYYGARRPPNQFGCKTRTVADLIKLGAVTIVEALCLIRILYTAGVSQVCVAGWSMGGIHAAMVAALSLQRVACTSMLPPRSAAAAYCDGTLAAFVDFPALRRHGGRDCHGQPLLPVLAPRFTAHPIMPNLPFVLRPRHGDGSVLSAHSSHTFKTGPVPQPQAALGAGGAVSAVAAGCTEQGTPGRKCACRFDGLRVTVEREQSGNGCVGAAACSDMHLLPGFEPETGRRRLLSLLPHERGTTLLRMLLPDASELIRFARRYSLRRTSAERGMATAAASAAVAGELQQDLSNVATGDAPEGATVLSRLSGLLWPALLRVRKSELERSVDLPPKVQSTIARTTARTTYGATLEQLLVQELSAAYPDTESEHLHSRGGTKGSRFYLRTRVRSGLLGLPSSWAQRQLRALRSMVLGGRAAGRGRATISEDLGTKTLLALTLEAHTDLARFPRPLAPEAVVFVAAADDAYVSAHSVEEAHKLWEGSQLVTAPGGHVTGFITLSSTYRECILRALSRL